MKNKIKNILLVLSPGEKRSFWILNLLNVIISIADIAALAFLLLIINFYIHPYSLSHLNFLPEWILDPDSILLIAVFLFLFSLKNMAGYFVNKAQFRFAYTVAARISANNLLHYFEGSYSGYVNTDSARHIRQISQQPVEFSHYVLSGMQQIITQSVLVLVAIFAIILFNAKLFLLLLLILLPAVLLAGYIMKKKLGQVRTHTKTSSEKTLQYLKEALGSYVESNIYDRHDFFLQRYLGFQQQLNKNLADLQIVQGMPGRLVEIFVVLGLFILIAVNKWMGNHATDILTIGAFMAAAYKIMPGIVKILNASVQMRTYEFTVHDLLQKKIISKKEVYELNEILSVEFEQTEFNYNPNKGIPNFNFKINKGEFAGLSGLSGAGKTTIINLLLGFLEPNKGSILVNNRITNPEIRKSFWRNISYVKQQPFLIHDSILCNITLTNKSYDHQKLDEAIGIAGLTELIQSFPEGIKYIITENGKNLSGGQRQRIALARALYKNADLIILDEPFSELDEESEWALLQNFKQMSQDGKMILLITHNKKSLSFCNKIVSLDEES